MTPLQSSLAPNRAATVFIFVTVVLDMLAFGIVIPVLPSLIEELLGGGIAQTAMIFGIFGVAWAAMQFLFSPVLGALSDRFGRRPVILLSCLGLGLDYVLMALAPSVAWLFVGRILSGITSANFATAGAYITDVTPPEKRAAAFGMLGAAFGLGFVAGPALGGVLGTIDLRLPFWVAAALSGANALYGLFVLPESLPREHRSRFSWTSANPLGSLKLLRSHPELAGLASANFLMELAHVALPSTAVLYMNYRYGWNEATVGLTLAAVGVFVCIVQGGLVGPVVARLGERRALLAGVLCGAAGFAVFGLAPTGVLFWIGIPLMALWGLGDAAAQGLLTRRVSAAEQGQLQGAIASIGSLAGMLGPGLFALAFASFIGPDAFWYLPGAAFFLASLLLMVSAFVAWHVTRSGAVHTR